MPNYSLTLIKKNFPEFQELSKVLKALFAKGQKSCNHEPILATALQNIITEIASFLGKNTIEETSLDIMLTELKTILTHERLCSFTPGYDALQLLNDFNDILTKIKLGLAPNDDEALLRWQVEQKFVHQTAAVLNWVKLEQVLQLCEFLSNTQRPRATSTQKISAMLRSGSNRYVVGAESTVAALVRTSLAIRPTAKRPALIDGNPEKEQLNLSAGHEPDVSQLLAQQRVSSMAATSSSFQLLPADLPEVKAILDLPAHATQKQFVQCFMNLITHIEETCNGVPAKKIEELFGFKPEHVGNRLLIPYDKLKPAFAALFLSLNESLVRERHPTYGHILKTDVLIEGTQTIACLNVTLIKDTIDRNERFGFILKT